MKKKWMIGIAVVAALGVLAVGFGANQAVAVETVEVKSDLFTDSFREDGIVHARDERPVYAQVSGIVEDVYLENGDSVLVGDVILELDKTQLGLRKKAIEGQIMSIQGQRQAESEKVKAPDLNAQQDAVNMAKTDMDQSKMDMDRLQKLFESGAVSQREMEQAQSAFNNSSSRYSMELARLNSLKAQNSVGSGTREFYEGQALQLQAELDIINDQLEKSVVRSEMAGTVSGLNLKAGEAVLSMTPVASILNTSEIEIEALVLAEEAQNLKVDQTIQIIRPNKGIEKIYKGRISRIDPVATETVSALGLKERRVLVKVVPEKDMIDGLIPGADVDVEFTAYASENAFVVPKSAVFPTKEGDAVWVIREGKIVLQNIETGYEATRFVEVVSGLSQGEHVLKNYDTEGISEGVAAKSNK